jgi:hypothetical protein
LNGRQQERTPRKERPKRTRAGDILSEQLPHDKCYTCTRPFVVQIRQSPSSGATRIIHVPSSMFDADHPAASAPPFCVGFPKDLPPRPLA